MAEVVGSLGPRIGHFKLNQGSAVTLKRFAPDQLVSLRDVHGLLNKGEAVLVPRALITKYIHVPFAAAGAGSAADFERYCTKLVLLPKLVRLVPDPAREGNLKDISAVGLELSSTGGTPRELEEFLSNAPEELRINSQTTIWLNPLAENGKFLAEQQVHWVLFDLVGRVKVGQMAAARGLSLSLEGRNNFATLYQMEIIDNLNSNNFGGFKYQNANRYLMSGLNGRQLLGSKKEIQQVLELFWTADKP